MNHWKHDPQSWSYHYVCFEMLLHSSSVLQYKRLGSKYNLHDIKTIHTTIYVVDVATVWIVHDEDKNIKTQVRWWINNSKMQTTKWNPNILDLKFIMTATMRSITFWCVTSCIPVEIYRRFRGIQYYQNRRHHIQEDNTFHFDSHENLKSSRFILCGAPCLHFPLHLHGVVLN
jgi:hypothetical protein